MSYLLSSAPLSPAERKRISRVDTSKFEAAMKTGIGVITEDFFGVDLSSSPNPPHALFVRGENECLLKPMVAIVGTRGASAYGKAVAQKFAEAFAYSGVIVVSGGALGIDEHAHKGALDAGGRTVAVFANGIDVVQPPRNAPLFKRIREQGCLVSPFAVGAPALEYRFKLRNDLVAAMSRAVVVIEAPESSGSLMTSTAALDLGREVFVVPGTIDRPSFRGSHALIRDGATLVDDPAQVLEALGFDHVSRKDHRSPASKLQESILEVLTAQPTAPENIVTEVGAGISEVMSELTLMELEGLVMKTAGGYSVKP
ncbi:MAG TPA: DNA-processing protein DprA [Fimbriimonadaceae bacterium]|nr:DNA-processing protein DprA [Fimbriimonadaceae bacterium]